MEKQTGVITTKYKNPPIAEAIFELFFIPRAWNATVPGLFYGHIKDRFPHIPQSQNGMGVMLGDQGIRISGGNPELTQFRNSQEDLIIQLTSNMLTVNKLPRYTTWEEFLPEIEFALNALREAVPIVQIQKVGLKYINKINAGEEHSYENIKRLFNLYPATPDGFEHNINSIQLSIEYPIVPGEEIFSVFLATLMPEPENNAPILFQLHSTLNRGEEFDVTSILEWLNKNAHVQINSAFESFLTEECKTTFNE